MRKLASVSFAFSAGIFAAYYVIPAGWLLYASAGLAALGLGAFFFSGDLRLRIQLICFAACAGLLWYWAYGLLFLGSAERLSGTEQEISVTVCDFPEARDYGYKVYVKASADGCRPVKAVVTDYSAAAGTVRPGDIITGTIRFNEKSGGDDYYNSKGIFISGYFRRIDNIESKNSHAAVYLPQMASEAVKGKIDNIFPESARAFVRALLTGDRSMIDADNSLSSALRISGASHIVAVSGMHMSFIVSMIMLLCGRKKRRAYLCIPFILAYMLFTGCSPSVVRAAVMQIFVIAAPLLHRENDAPTSLGASLLLLLVFNPYYAGNIGLQLSFAAVAGMLAVTPQLSSKLFRRLRRLKAYRFRPVKAVLGFLCSVLSATAGALVFTVPLTALHFKSVSVLSPVTNILVLWAVSAAFCVSVIACVLGFVFTPLGSAAAWAASFAVRYIIAVVKTISAIPFAAVYTSNAYIRFWMLFAFSFGAVLYLSKEIKHKTALYVSALALSLAVSILFTVIGNRGTYITVINVGQGQCIAVRSNGMCAVIDCGGNITGGAGNAAADFLASVGENRIDLMLLTHFHSDHTNGLEDLHSRMSIDCLVLPADASGDKDSILRSAHDMGIAVSETRESGTVRLGSVILHLYPQRSKPADGDMCMSIMVECGQFEALITGDISMRSEEKLIAEYEFPDVEVLVAGHHGSEHSLSQKLLQTVTPEAVIISVGKNGFGHPSGQTIDRILDAGCLLYRTDENGNITVKAG